MTVEEWYREKAEIPTYTQLIEAVKWELTTMPNPQREQELKEMLKEFITNKNYAEEQFKPKPRKWH